MTNEDASIARRLRAGDAAAFEQLFRRYYAPLCLFAQRYIESAAIAEELVQDLFTHLWLERARWDAPRNLRAYLYRAVRNRALNARTRGQRERDWSDDEAVASQHLTQDVDPLAPAEAADLLHRLEQAIAALPERCRLVMHLRWHEQMRYGEIADVMGISVKGVENQLARGLRALRDKLGNRR